MHAQASPGRVVALAIGLMAAMASNLHADDKAAARRPRRRS